MAMVDQILSKERGLVDFVRDSGFSAAKLRGRLFH